MRSVRFRIVWVALAGLLVLGVLACEKAEVKSDAVPTGDGGAGVASGAKTSGGEVVKAPKVEVSAPDHSGFDALLKKYVTAEGQVKYGDWKANADDMKALDAYVVWVEGVDASKMSKEDALPFFINGYNAIVIQAVLSKYPEFPGVLKVDGFFDKTVRKVAGEEHTLNDLEKKKIREPYGEPRIHFVVNCASGSCPVILPTAITRDNIEASLESGAKKYVLQETKLSEDKSTVDTSHIFNWYADDFKASGGVNAFLAKYVAASDAEAVKTAKVTFHDYDWTLNEAEAK